MTIPSGAVGSGDGTRSSVGKIVQAVLDKQAIDETIDLFDQGVTSLAFIRIVAQLNERYSITVDVKALEEASISSLSALVDTQINGKSLTVGG